MNGRDKAEDELRQALGDACRAMVKVLDREHCRISDVLALELRDVWTGRFHLRPKIAIAEYCVNHEFTRNPCGLCPPLDFGDDDDD